MHITKFLYLAIIILFSTFTQTAELRKVATFCTLINGLGVVNPIIVNEIPFPKCEKLDGLSLYQPFVINLIAHVITRVVDKNYNDANLGIVLSTGIAANILNIGIMGYIIWQRYQAFVHKEKKREDRKQRLRLLMNKPQLTHYEHKEMSRLMVKLNKITVS